MPIGLQAFLSQCSDLKLRVAMPVAGCTSQQGLSKLEGGAAHWVWPPVMRQSTLLISAHVSAAGRLLGMVPGQRQLGGAGRLWRPHGHDDSRAARWSAHPLLATGERMLSGGEGFIGSCCPVPHAAQVVVIWRNWHA